MQRLVCPQLTGHETRPETNTLVGHSYQSSDVGRGLVGPIKQISKEYGMLVRYMNGWNVDITYLLTLNNSSADPKPSR